MLRSVLIAGALAAALPAYAFTSSNRMNVDATGPVTFAVSARGGGSGPADFWCAAGEFATKMLSASISTLIYRISEPPNRGGVPVVFSLDPAGKASSSGLSGRSNDDGSVSVGKTRGLCEAARQASMNSR